jgi:hypothetical protein
VPEEPLEDGLDLVRSSEDALDAGPTAPDAQDDEIAHRSVPGCLAVDDDRNAPHEERVAHEELAATGQRADECLQLATSHYLSCLSKSSAR